MAGAIVYWRAGDRRSSRELGEGIDAGIVEGREAAAALQTDADDSRQFDQR